MANVRGLAVWALAAVLIAAACGGDGVFEGTSTSAAAAAMTSPLMSATTEVTSTTAATSSTTSAPASTSTTSPPATATTATSSSSTTTTTTTMPGGFDPSLTDRLYAVVLVAADDVLNVRSGPGIDNAAFTDLAPTTTDLALTGNVAEVGAATWVEVETPPGAGWVNKRFLTEMWTSAEVDAEWDLTGPLDVFADETTPGGDLSGPVSYRGLYAVYFDDELRHWSRAELTGIMADPTLYTWSGTGCYQCVEMTWADAVAFDLYGAYEDEFDDAVFALDDIILGGNGPFPPQAAIPVPLQNFHWLMIHDPGDDPAFGGLDWVTWFVYYDYEDGEAKIVGLSPAAWAP